MPVHRYSASGAAMARRVDAKMQIVEAVPRLDRRHRFGGLVPLDAIRRETGLPRADFDRAVLEMDREGPVDFKIANDPRRLSPGERAAAILIPGRGHLFFAVNREG